MLFLRADCLCSILFSILAQYSDTGEATLRIVGVAADDDGVYTCVATNDLGSVTSSASLRVLGETHKHTQCTGLQYVCK